MKKYIYVFIIIVSFSTFIFLQKDQFFLELQTRKSATAAAAWIFSHQNEVIDPGVIWVLSEININYCDSNTEITTRLNDMFNPFRTNKVESAYERLINSNFLYTVSTSTLQNRKQYFDDILIPALYCDTQPELISETVRRSIELSKQAGYKKTHALLAFVWMQKRHCLSADEEKYIQVIVDGIASEQKNAKEFNDLYAERVAFMEYVQNANRVTSDTILTIIDNQEKSGGWKDHQGSSYFGPSENTHTTVLSLWALTQFSEHCPFYLK